MKPLRYIIGPTHQHGSGAKQRWPEWVEAKIIVNPQQLQGLSGKDRRFLVVRPDLLSDDMAYMLRILNRAAPDSVLVEQPWSS